MNHLWEMKHPYYCNEGNYFQSGMHYSFASWGDFVAEWDSADLDMNLIFRFDWKPAGKEHESNQDRLFLYYIGQRKAKSWSVGVCVEKSDEIAIVEWLRIRAKHMVSLWEPLLNDPTIATVADESDVPEPSPTEDADSTRLGACDCCEAPGVVLSSYRSGAPFSGTVKWLCQLCANTQISTWIEYSSQYRDGRGEMGRALSHAANMVLAAIAQAGSADERERAAQRFADALGSIGDRTQEMGRVP